MNLFIYGASGYGYEALDIATRMKKWDDIFFIDDNKEGIFAGKRIVSFYDFDQNFSCNESEVIIAIGEPKIRKHIYEKVKLAGYHFATLIDPNAVISEFAVIGEGSMISAGVYLAGNFKCGVNCGIQPGDTAGHDTVVGDHVIISPNVSLSGGCKLGDCVFIGAGATILQKTIIGKNAIVSMGTAVYRNVEEGSVVVGNPGRISKPNPEGKVFQ